MKMNNIVASYCEDIKEYFNILKSKDFTKKYILNIDNNTNQMVVPEEMMEDIFGSRFEYIKKNKLFSDEVLKYFKVLERNLNKVFKRYWEGKDSLHDVFEDEKIKDIILIFDKIIHNIDKCQHR